MKHSEQSRFDPINVKREIRSRMMLTGLGAVLVAVLAFLGTIYLFQYSALLPETAGYGAAAKQLNWSLLEGMASIAALSFIVGGLVFAFAEYTQRAIQARRESAEVSFNIYRDVFDRIMSHEAMAARRWIILNIPTPDQMDNDRPSWLKHVNAILDECPVGGENERPPGREYLKHVLNTLDFLGFTARHYWNMENELAEWLSPPVSKVWERISLYVEDEAMRRNEADFYQAARDFGDFCLEWRRKNYPESTVVDSAT